MCHPRPIQSDSDDESSWSSTKSLFNVSKLALQKNQAAATRTSTGSTLNRQKSGRKGDPRMHRALEARLNNPKSSLLDALTKGGFEFHMVDNVWYDKDNILLSQRKNQLSRRVRLFKQSLQKQDPVASSNEEEFQGEVISQVKFDDDNNNQSTGKSEQNNLKRYHEVENELVNTTSAKKQKLSATEAAIPASFTISVSPSSSKGPSSFSSSASLKGAAIGPASVTSSELNSSQEAKSQKQIKVSPTIGGNGRSTSSAVAKAISTKDSASSNEKFSKAMNLYLHHSIQLMKSCLESAGFSKDQCKENGRLHSKFAEKILFLEFERLKKNKKLKQSTSSSNSMSSSSSFNVNLFQDVAISSVSGNSSDGNSSPDLNASADAFAKQRGMTTTENINNFFASALSKDLMSAASVKGSLGSFNQSLHSSSSLRQGFLPTACPPPPCRPLPLSVNYGLNAAVNQALPPFVQPWNRVQASMQTSDAAAPEHQAFAQLHHPGAPSNIYSDGRLTAAALSSYNQQDVMKKWMAAQETDRTMKFTSSGSISSNEGPKVYDLSASNIIDDQELVDILRKSSKNTGSDDERFQI